MQSRYTYSHDDTADAYVGTQSFPYPRALPEDAHDAFEVFVSFRYSSGVYKDLLRCRTRSCSGP